MHDSLDPCESARKRFSRLQDTSRDQHKTHLRRDVLPSSLVLAMRTIHNINNVIAVINRNIYRHRAVITGKATATVQSPISS